MTVTRSARSCATGVPGAAGKLAMQGADMTTEQISAFQRAEVAKWAQVIKAANIKLE